MFSWGVSDGRVSTVRIWNKINNNMTVLLKYVIVM